MTGGDNGNSGRMPILDRDRYENRDDLLMIGLIVAFAAAFLHAIYRAVR
jgi:hypothetical protein